MIRGPLDWEDAERSIRAFADVLADEGLRGTFFVAPEALGRLCDVAQELAQAGMELGMLCHPQLSNYQSFLGCYGYDREREVIQLQKQIWQERLGTAPVNFRGGFFSASDYTFQILCLEGFHQGSCSLPGRIDAEQCSIWQGACPSPHHTDPLDRKAAGTMDFYEVPVTSQHDAPEYAPAETFTPPHLRIEAPDINEYARGLMERTLGWMDAERVPVKAVTFVTQNSAGWGGPEDPLTERLHNLASLLRSVAQRAGMRIEPADLAGLHQAADLKWRSTGAGR